MTVNHPTTENGKDERRSIRPALKIPMTILGKDCNGKEFAVSVKTVNVSTRGFSLELPRQCVQSGNDVFISVATKFNARATVRWLETDDESSPMLRCGVELVEPYSNWVLTD